MSDLLEQQRITNRLLVLLVRQHMTQGDVIEALEGFGLTGRDMGALLGTSGAVIAVTKQRRRKRAAQEQTHGKAIEIEEGHAVSDDPVREAGGGTE